MDEEQLKIREFELVKIHSLIDSPPFVKLEQFLNIELKSLIFDTSQSPIGWLKASAL